ncbi:MAG: DNA alkylation repair protein [Bacillales bacterium]|jgi:3-methyladenine DNA glycosylase AlkD|nr:DNA alkylation repair protein [Bacillales bacterium]
MKQEIINEKLESLASEKTALFSKRLSPASKYKILGVTIPNLRKLAKEIVKEGYQEYLKDARLDMFEDIMLYGFVINEAKLSLNDTFYYIDKLIPLMDDWAQTDCILFPKVMLKHPKETIEHYLDFQKDSNYLKQRIFGLAIIQLYARKKETVSQAITYLKGIPSKEYYSQMVVAWALADSAVANYSQVLQELKLKTFTPWIHNKAIQKIRESRRISQEQKDELNLLKIR